METVSVGLGFHQIVLWAGERIEMSEMSDWNVWNIGLKSQYGIEMARWNVWRCGTSYRHIAILGHYHLYYHCGEFGKKCRLGRPRLSVSILVNTYGCLWVPQKLLKSCGGIFQTCRYKNHLHLFHPVLARKFLSLDTDIDNQIDAANGLW